MSGRADDLVLRYGPADPQLTLLCVAVSNWMNADGHGARVGSRILAERARTSKSGADRMLRQAVDEGWLAVENPGGPRRATTYGLGPAIIAAALARHFPAQIRPNTPQVWGAAPQTPTWLGALTPQVSYEFGAQTYDGSHTGSAGAPTTRAGTPAPGGQPPPRVAPHPPSCPVCHGHQWVDADNGGRSVRRCPGPTATTDDDDDERDDP